MQDDKQDEQPQRGRRIDRRPDHQGSSCSSSGRSRRGSSGATNDYLFSNGTEPGSIPQTQTRDAGVRQGDLSRRAACTANGSVLSTPTALRQARCRPTTAPGRSSSAARSPATPRRFPRVQARIRRTSAATSTSYLSGASFAQRARRLFHDNYQDTGVSTTTARHLEQRRRLAWRACPPNLQAPERRPEHAARADHEQGPDADAASSRPTTTTRSTPPARTC